VKLTIGDCLFPLSSLTSAHSKRAPQAPQADMETDTLRAV